MNKNAKIWIGVGSVLALATAGYFILRPQPEESVKESDEDDLSPDTETSPTASDLLSGVSAWTTSTTPSGSSTPVCERVSRFPLRKTDAGEQVKTVQQFINKFHNRKITEDCKYGDNTATAVNSFFRQNYVESTEGVVTKSVYNNIIVPSLRDGKLVDVKSIWNLGGILITWK